MTWIVKTQVRSFGFVIQDFSSHGISIPIVSSNKFTKKLVKMSRQNCQIGAIPWLTESWIEKYITSHGCCRLINLTILTQQFHKFFGKFITGPYWNAYPMTLKILDCNPSHGITSISRKVSKYFLLFMCPFICLFMCLFSLFTCLFTCLFLSVSFLQ